MNPKKWKWVGRAILWFVQWYFGLEIVVRQSADGKGWRLEDAIHRRL